MVIRTLCSLTRLYTLVFVAWILFSWFSVDSESRLYPLYKACDIAAGWVMRPLRRLFRPVQIGEVAVDFTVLIPLIVLSTILPAIFGCRLG